MAGGRRRRLQYKWDCWRGDRAAFEHVLATFDEVALTELVDHDDDPTGTRSSTAEATSRQRGQTTEQRGDWRTVLDDADVGGLDAFTIMVPGPMREDAGDLRLEFSRADGAVLWAGPRHADTIERVRSELEPAVASGVPKRAWWYSNIAELVMAVVLGVVIELAWLVISNHIGHPDLLDFLPLPIGILVAFGVVRLLRPLFPRFEVRERAR
jgi:hypothetical protein